MCIFAACSETERKEKVEKEEKKTLQVGSARSPGLRYVMLRDVFYLTVNYSASSCAPRTSFASGREIRDRNFPMRG